MKASRFAVVPVALAASAFLMRPATARPEGDKPGDDLEKRLTKLDAAAPGLGELMNNLAHSFGDLWFALDRQNWLLAGFYLDKSREALDRTIAVEPMRKLSSGRSMPLKGLADALSKTQFAQIQQAIAKKDRGAAISAYNDAMKVCTSCHMMFERPFLKLQTPAAPSSNMIQFETGTSAP